MSAHRPLFGPSVAMAPSEVKEPGIANNSQPTVNRREQRGGAATFDGRQHRARYGVRCIVNFLSKISAGPEP